MAVGAAVSGGMMDHRALAAGRRAALRAKTSLFFGSQLHQHITTHFGCYVYLCFYTLALSIRIGTYRDIIMEFVD